MGTHCFAYPMLEFKVFGVADIFPCALAEFSGPGHRWLGFRGFIDSGK
jgi:hypothetical protein